MQNMFKLITIIFLTFFSINAFAYEEDTFVEIRKMVTALDLSQEVLIEKLNDKSINVSLDEGFEIHVLAMLVEVSELTGWRGPVTIKRATSPQKRKFMKQGKTIFIDTSLNSNSIFNLLYQAKKLMSETNQQAPAPVSSNNENDSLETDIEDSTSEEDDVEEETIFSSLSSKFSSLTSKIKNKWSFGESEENDETIEEESRRQNIDEGSNLNNTTSFDETTLSILYSNEDYLQLLEVILDKVSIKEIIERHYSLEIMSEGQTQDGFPYQEFSKEELLTLYKQLIDLPVIVLRKLRLKKIYRVINGAVKESKYGYVLGDYSLDQERIQMYDSAFEKNGDQFGEGTLIHELGHAVWYGLEDDLKGWYLNISWKYNDGEWGKRFGNLFVSEYSTSDPLEDFAEHFAAYVRNPELLKSKASIKYQWLKENVFDGVEYKNQAKYKNTSIKLEGSKTPDYTAPYFINNIKDSISIETEELNESELLIKIAVTGLVDDVSGVESITIFLESDSESRKEKLIIVRLDQQSIIDAEKGSYQLQMIIDKNGYANGRFYLDWVSVKDFSGRESSYLTERIEGQSILVESQDNQFENKEFQAFKAKVASTQIDENNIQINKQLNSQESAYKVILPLSSTENFRYIDIYWRVLGSEDLVFEHKIFISDTNLTVKSNHLELNVIVPSYVPNSQIKMSSVKVVYELDDELQSKVFKLNDNLENLLINFEDGSSISQKPVSISPQEIQLNFSETGENNGKVAIDIPVSSVAGANIPGALFEGNVTLMTPDGLEINGQFKSEEVFSGQQTVTVIVELPTNYVSGVYILSEAVMKIDVSSSYSDNSAYPDSTNILEVKEDLVERMILLPIEDRLGEH